MSIADLMSELLRRVCDDRPFVLLFEDEDGVDRTVSNLSEDEIPAAYEQAAQEIREGNIDRQWPVRRSRG